MPSNSVSSVVCDPPYELGFMGKRWDGTGIANSVELWTEVLRVLKPGGHLAAFSGSRTYHRMACAIEDAGFAPPHGIVLDIFAGSGTTGEAAFLEGFKSIMIERDLNYQTHIRARMLRIAKGDPDDE